MAQTAAKDEVGSGLPGRTIVLIIVGFVALILGGVLVQDGGGAQCILPFVGFVIASVGLAISFLGLNEDIFRLTVQTTEIIWKRSAKCLIILGFLLYIVGVFWPEEVYFRFSDKARFEVMKLTRWVEEYKTRTGAYPTALAPLDPWGVPYEYHPDGPRNSGRHPDIWTITPSGELIGNWMPMPASTRGVLPFIGFLIAMIGLGIAFLGLREKRLQTAVQKITSILRTSAAGMIVFGFLLYIGATFGPRYLEHTKSGDARASINTLSYAAEAYKLKFGAYPTNLDQLVQPPDGGSPFVEPDAILDPWRRRYGYNGEGPHNKGKRPDIWTVGHDGKVIANWIPPSRCD